MTACECSTCVTVRALEQQKARADELASELLAAGERIRALESAAREAMGALRHDGNLTTSVPAADLKYSAIEKLDAAVGDAAGKEGE